VDVTYYLHKAFEAVGLVWDVKKAPPHAIRNEPATPRAAA